MGDTNADTGTANAGTDTQNADKIAQSEAAKKTEKTFTQAELDAIVQKRLRDLKPAVEERDALAAKLAEYEAKQREAEEAKLSATQRAELERKRERESWEKKLADLDTTAKREREKRHEILRSQRAASAVATFASKLLNDRLAPVVETQIASRLVVEVQGDGTERLMVRMSDAAADLEPVETALPKLIDAEIAPVFFRAQGGAGSQHGGNGGGGASSWRNLSPADKIAAGLGAKR